MITVLTGALTKENIFKKAAEIAPTAKIMWFDDQHPKLQIQETSHFIKQYQGEEIIIPTFSLFVIKVIRNYFEEQNRDSETQFILIEENEGCTEIKSGEMNLIFKTFSDVLQPLVWENVQ